MNDKPAQTAGVAEPLLRLIALERQARRCGSREELVFFMANETYRLLPYFQALFFRLGRGGQPRLEVVSAVATLDRATPFAQWAEEFCREALRCRDADAADKPALIRPDALPQAVAANWSQHLPPHVLLCPLAAPGKGCLAVLLLARETPFLAQESSLMEVLADAYGHALAGFTPAASSPFPAMSRKKKLRIGLIAAATILALLFLVRIPETVLAPAEIVPRDPVVVTAPARGQIRDIAVQPYQLVQKGQLLFQLDDTELVNQLALAQKNLQVVRAEYLRTAQKAFSDPMSKADLEVLRVQAEEKALIAQYTQEELERQKITASQDGMVLFSDRNDWLGRPVAIGEKVMTLADPAQAEVRILMPVDDAIALEPGARVKLFLRTDPLNPVTAEISRTSFKAEELPGGGMGFPLRARLAEADGTARIGLQGTAKVYGGRVSLFYYVFRKPLSIMRREFGL